MRNLFSRKVAEKNTEMPPVASQGAAEMFAKIRSLASLVITKGKHADVQKMCEILQTASASNTQTIDIAADSKKLEELAVYSGRSNPTFPLAFIKGDCVGNLVDLVRLDKDGHLKERFKEHDYDLIVIGGGSGGLAAAKEAAGFGKKVAVLDLVKPTPLGTDWGLGGTCVNVGCIPKKLMHQAAILGAAIQDSSKFGWNLTKTADNNHTQINHDWKTLTTSVQDHIGSLNWGYRVQLRNKAVTYTNAFGRFTGPNTINATDKKGKSTNMTADRFLIATGLRPRYPDVPGAKEYCITSDDLFSLKYNPGQTLLVGASYVSLECAGFLRGIGLDVTVMVRSILLRGFDQDMAERVGAYIKEEGVELIRGAVPTKVEQIEKGSPGKLRVTAKTTEGKTIVGEYNTVIFAIGRDAITDDLNLDSAKIERSDKSKKIVTYANEQSVSCPNVYAVGDVALGRPELTPAAIQAGRVLMRRIFGDSNIPMDYVNIATTVFTPLEYGACGLAEEDAIQQFGEENVEVYHSLFEPLEFTVTNRKPGHCYAKVICNKKDNLRLVGMHILGPNAGEIMQGFAIALKMRACKHDLDNLVGIHPTCAEVFTNLTQIKRPGDASLEAAGC